MRQIGSLDDQQQADRFSDYLLTQGIETLVEAAEAAGEWSVWVRDEDRLEESREELRSFLQQPTATKYREAGLAAERMREETRRRKAAAARRTVDVRRDIWAAPATRRMPLTLVLIVICVVAALVTGAGRNRQSRAMRDLAFVDRAHLLDKNFDGRRDGLVDIKRGQVWRLITPILLHSGLTHLLFNMLMLYSVGAIIEGKRGSPLLGVLVLIIALVSNLAQFLLSGPWFVGMSGVVYGLFGYTWMRMRTAPEEGLRMSQELMLFLIVWMVLGFSNALQPLGISMANWAHLFGLLTGLALAWMMPRRQFS